MIIKFKIDIEQGGEDEFIPKNTSLFVKVSPNIGDGSILWLFRESRDLTTPDYRISSLRFKEFLKEAILTIEE